MQFLNEFLVSRDEHTEKKLQVRGAFTSSSSKQKKRITNFSLQTLKHKHNPPKFCFKFFSSTQTQKVNLRNDLKKKKSFPDCLDIFHYFSAVQTQHFFEKFAANNGR